MKKEFVPFKNKVWLSSPTMHNGEEMKYVEEAYNTNWMSTVGENINEVERITCEKVGCKYAVGLASGTAAIHLAIKLAGVKPGDKVFCSDMTFSATVNPVLYASSTYFISSPLCIVGELNQTLFLKGTNCFSILFTIPLIYCISIYYLSNFFFNIIFIFI